LTSKAQGLAFVVKVLTHRIRAVMQPILPGYGNHSLGEITIIAL